MDRTGRLLFEDSTITNGEILARTEALGGRKEQSVSLRSPKSRFLGNRVSCQVTLDQPKALVFSIPYNPGWSLPVDGKEAELKKANGMFMAAWL